MRRRTFLAAGLVTGTALAGCAGDADGSGGQSDDGGPTGSTAAGTPTPSGDGQRLESHPAAAGLGTQPTLGPDPSGATAVIVAYEDPSCPRCARFENEVVPALRSEYVAAGDLSLVFRGYPVVYEWGAPATRALEAVYDRSADAHWTLAEHYFGNQDDFRGGSDDVYPKTRSFLDASTDLDGEAVVREAAEGAHDDSVQADLDAGMAAGAGQTTPHLFLFREGTYRTKATGYVSRDVLTSALQL
jgi:protein-disulfide isomerase